MVYIVRTLLDGVTERMTEVQKATHATLALIFGNDARLDSHSTKHSFL